MQSTNKSKTVSKAKSTNNKSPNDAISILKADHKLVDGLFKQYEDAKTDKKKKELVDEICKELTIHAKVEEEIFYPAVQAALKDHELVPEAMVEHGSLKDLIAAVKGKQPEGDMYDAKIKVMSEYVKHHVKEEEKEMFPEVKATKLDLAELGEKILARKEKLAKAYA